MAQIFAASMAEIFAANTAEIFAANLAEIFAANMAKIFAANMAEIFAEPDKKIKNFGRVASKFFFDVSGGEPILDWLDLDGASPK